MKGEEDSLSLSLSHTSLLLLFLLLFIRLVSLSERLVTYRNTRLSRLRFVITRPSSFARTCPQSLFYISYIYIIILYQPPVSLSLSIDPLVAPLVTFSHSLVHTHMHSLPFSFSRFFDIVFAVSPINTEGIALIIYPQILLCSTVAIKFIYYQ